MMIVRSKMGFDPDLNLRRWLYALDFREPPPEIFGFFVQEQSWVSRLVQRESVVFFSLYHSFLSRLFLCDKIINCCTHLTLFACYKTTGVRRKRCNIGCWNLGFKQGGRFRRFVYLNQHAGSFANTNVGGAPLTSNGGNANSLLEPSGASGKSASESYGAAFNNDALGTDVHRGLNSAASDGLASAFW